ncbi:hypothetical protein GcM1_233098 [Golovinomyces cichoracearum]|uniref:Vacuolar ATPase assembly protein VMA22 n=1 Tax=Golovinomyces cichoracearum TaxID=62708 RepID=A0A420IM08_9PEZI|nr:hypothetical protein GcM1_233098 [Golovinomyces cichoracearum]
MDLSDPSDNIEILLEEYLRLVDEYDRVRQSFCTLHTSARQHLARANFTAARGIRYGKDLYDSRMQALRSCRITEDVEKGKIAFAIYMKDTKKAHQNLQLEEKVTENPVKSTYASSPKTSSSEDNTGEKTKANSSSTIHDPIRMFGILIPQSLRLAQGDFIKIVYLIPRLVEINVELVEIEIKIRRIQKYRAEVIAKAKESETDKRLDKIKMTSEE